MGYVSPFRRSTYSPIDGKIRLTSRYGPRTNPVTGEPQALHNGIDLGVPVGTPVYPMKPGVVTGVDASCNDPRNGAYFSVRHADGAKSTYVHMSEVFVREGQRVDLNTKLGLTGGAAGNPCSGRSTGPHLHLIIRPDGKNSIDPAPVINWYPHKLANRSGQVIPHRNERWGGTVAAITTHTPIAVWVAVAASLLLTIGFVRRGRARRQSWEQIASGRPRTSRRRLR